MRLTPITTPTITGPRNGGGISLKAVLGVGPTGATGPTGPTGPSGGPFPDLTGVTAGKVPQTLGGGAVEFVDLSATTEDIVVPMLESERAVSDATYALVQGAPLEQSPGKNLYDKNADNGADTFYNNTGAVITLAGWYASAKIPGEVGQQFTINTPRQIITFGGVDGATFKRYINNASETAATVTLAADETHFAFNVAAAKRDTAQAELGAVATSFEPYGVKIQRQIANGAYLEDQLVDLAEAVIVPRSSGVRVYRTGSELLVRSAFDATRDILMPVQLQGGSNGVVRLVTSAIDAVRLVAADEPDLALWPIMTASYQGIHVTSDDNAPLRQGALYVGANHGWPSAFNVTLTAHGKTNADRGSTWSDGTRTYTLVKVVDANTILFAGQYSVASGVVTPNVTAPAATLTHVANATNTGDISIAGGVAATQLWPSIHSQTTDVSLDGTPVDDGTSVGEALTISETYQIVSFKGFVDWSRANIGSDPFASASLAAMTQYGRVSNTYRFTAAQVIPAQTFTALDETVSLMMGVTQANALSKQGGLGSRVQFMPGVGTVSGVDFTTYASIESIASTLTIALAGQRDANVPPTRMVQWHLDGSSARLYGLEMGILPVMDGKLATRKTNGTDTTGWYISSAKKNYPQLAWAKTLTAGQSLSGEAFRRYLPPDAPAAQVITDGARHWLTIDEPTANSTPKIARVPRLLGRKLTTVAGENVTTARSFVDGEGVTYTNTAPGHLLAEATVDTTV